MARRKRLNKKFMKKRNNKKKNIASQAFAPRFFFQYLFFSNYYCAFYSPCLLQMLKNHFFYRNNGENCHEFKQKLEHGVKF